VSIHLVGGGWSEHGEAATYLAFVREAAARAESRGVAGPPRIAVIVVRDGDGVEHADRLVSELTHAGPIDAVVTSLVEGISAPPGLLAEVDGILIGGGLTPAYLDSLAGIFDEIRSSVADGVPYLGFSAGAMIAPDHALIGGWRIGGVAVCAEATSEELDEVTIVEGIGLIDVTVDVHTAQWGTLSPLVAATAAGLTEGGVAIDESTTLIVSDDGFEVVGAGNVWRVSRSDHRVAIDILGS
jgi:cyanophycinase